MSQLLLSLGLVALGAALNLSGVIALKHAHQSGSQLAAIAGCLAFAGTSMVFVQLLSTRHDLSVVSIITSVAGFLAVIVIGALYYNEVLSARQWIGVGVLIFGMALVGVPAK